MDHETSPPNGSIDDVLEVLRRPGMFLGVSNRFALVCAFLTGAQWADRQVLRGFEAYLSMTFESDRVRGWPAIVAFQCGADRDAAIALLHGGGSEDDNAVAIEFLKEHVAEFAALVRSGEIDRYVDDYLASGGVHP